MSSTSMTMIGPSLGLSRRSIPPLMKPGSVGPVSPDGPVVAEV